MIPESIREIKVISVEFSQQATEHRQERCSFLQNGTGNKKPEIHEPVYFQGRQKCMYEICLSELSAQFHFPMKWTISLIF